MEPACRLRWGGVAPLLLKMRSFLIVLCKFIRLAGIYGDWNNVYLTPSFDISYTKRREGGQKGHR